MGHDVAGRAGEGVVAPRASDAIGLLEDREVVKAGLLETDRGADTAGAGAEYRDPRSQPGGLGLPHAKRGAADAAPLAVADGVTPRRASSSPLPAPGRPSRGPRGSRCRPDE